MKPSKAFDSFLQDGKTLPSDPEERELARLLMEVAETEVPDPGPAYWLHFNQRLDQKIAALPPKKLNWFGRHPALWPTFVLAGALLAIFALTPLFQNPAPSPQLDQLSEQSLAIVASLSDSSDPFFHELSFEQNLDLQLSTDEADILSETVLDEY